MIYNNNDMYRDLPISSIITSSEYICIYILYYIFIYLDVDIYVYIYIYYTYIYIHIVKFHEVLGFWDF